MPHTVLIVEDDTSTREYFAEALRGDDWNYLVTLADSLEQGMQELRRVRPEVLLVDLGLPDGSGLELIRCAGELSKNVLILVISVFGDEQTVINAVEAGAQGYLLKSEAPEDLRESVRQILAGGAPISPGIASHLLRRFQGTLSEKSQDDTRLTPREQDVLELMVKGLPYQEAADALGLTRNTVASYVKNIYTKLHVNSRGEAVYEALSKGIVKLGAKD